MAILPEKTREFQCAICPPLKHQHCLSILQYEQIKKLWILQYFYHNAIDVFHMFSLFLPSFLPTPTILPCNNVSVIISVRTGHYAENKLSTSYIMRRGGGVLSFKAAGNSLQLFPGLDQILMGHYNHPLSVKCTVNSPSFLLFFCKQEFFYLSVWLLLLLQSC